MSGKPGYSNEPRVQSMNKLAEAMNQEAELYRGSRLQEAEEEGELEIDSGPRNLYDVKGM